MGTEVLCPGTPEEEKEETGGRKIRVRMLVRKVDSNSISKGGSTPGYLQELGFTAPRLKLGS